MSETSVEIQKLVQKKQEIGNERDLCAEMYNLWITRLHDYQEDVIKYKMYMELISHMEPYVNTLKEEMREINRQICKIEGVESISETEYVRECNNTHGLDMPNA